LAHPQVLGNIATKPINGISLRELLKNIGKKKTVRFDAAWRMWAEYTWEQRPRKYGNSTPVIFRAFNRCQGKGR
jgi:hypothetical protein